MNGHVSKQPAKITANYKLNRKVTAHVQALINRQVHMYKQVYMVNAFAIGVSMTHTYVHAYKCIQCKRTNSYM